MYDDELEPEISGLHICPVCGKIYMEEKAMYLHITRAHQEAQRLAYDFQADMYRRWQNRLPRLDQ